MPSLLLSSRPHEGFKVSLPLSLPTAHTHSLAQQLPLIPTPRRTLNHRARKAAAAQPSPHPEAAPACRLPPARWPPSAGAPPARPGPAHSAAL